MKQKKQTALELEAKRAAVVTLTPEARTLLRAEKFTLRQAELEKRPQTLCGDAPQPQKKPPRRAAGLWNVKSLVVLILTAAFAYMAVTGKVSQDFMTVYVVIITFYFGICPQKARDGAEQDEEAKT